MSSILLIRFGLYSPKIWQQTVRHRGKFNVPMPKPRHEIARYLEEITKPVLIRELADPVEQAFKDKQRLANKLKIGNETAIEFEKFLAKYAIKQFEANEVVLVCHKLDCPGESFRRSKVEFKRNQASIHSFNTVTMNLMIENNPKYQNLHPIVNNALGRNLYIFCSEASLKSVLNSIKKMPHLAVLGGIVHQTLMTRNAIQEYDDLPGLDTARGQLVATIGHQMSQLSTTLNSSQQKLSQALKQLTESSGQ